MDDWLEYIITVIDKVRWELEKTRWEMYNWDLETEYFESSEGREFLENTKQKCDYLELKLNEVLEILKDLL